METIAPTAQIEALLAAFAVPEKVVVPVFVDNDVFAVLAVKYLKLLIVVPLTPLLTYNGYVVVTELPIVMPVVAK